MIINVAPLLKQPVGTHAGYHVAEDPIDPRGDNAGLRELGARSVDASITATHTNPGAYFEGEAEARVEVECSRCLRLFETVVHADFAEQYYATIGVEHGEALAEAPHVHDESRDERWARLEALKDFHAERD